MKKKNFIFIELLVVIAIIAILASMLLPALNQARETAKGIACVNNQKQIGTAYVMYFGDWDGNFPYRKFWEAGAEWRKRLNTYLKAPNYPGSAFPATGGVFLCPSDLKKYATGVPYAQLWGSYAHTAYLKMESDGPVFPAVKVNQIKKTSSVIVLTEREVNTYNYNFTAAPGTVNELYYRHSDKANFLFVDGHVQPYKYNELQVGLNSGELKYKP